MSCDFSRVSWQRRHRNDLGNMLTHEFWLRAETGCDYADRDRRVDLVEGVVLRGSPASARILRRWAELFGKGPADFDLRGAYQWIEGESVESGRYERTRLNRENLVHQLSAVADLAELVAPRDDVSASPGNLSCVSERRLP